MQEEKKEITAVYDFKAKFLQPCVAETRGAASLKDRGIEWMKWNLSNLEAERRGLIEN